jgi:glycosyltransferase involved in cell wall biosynthesis
MNATQFLHTTTWPVYRYKGQIYTTDLWRRDLEHFFEYLKCVTLASPIIDGPPPWDASPIQPDLVKRLRLIHIPKSHSDLERLRNAPEYLIRLLLAIRNVEAFQCIIVEHPILFGLMFPFLKRFSHVKIITLVESSSWQKANPSAIRKFYARIIEYFARIAVKNSTISIHTSNGYRRAFAGKSETSFVIPAVWIEESDIITMERFDENLKGRLQPNKLRVGYFGWLTYEKGLDILIDAVLNLQGQGADVKLDIYGEGPKREEFIKRANPNNQGIRFCGTLPYGPMFFHKLADYDVIAVPNRSDEQVRIVLDAFSQGVPVIACDVPGQKQTVRNNFDGLLVPKENHQAFAEALQKLYLDVDLRMMMSQNARLKATTMSHQKMHQHRAKVIRQVAGPLTQLIPF